MSSRQKKPKHASNGVRPATDGIDSTPTSSISGLLLAAADSIIDRDSNGVKVNNANVTELKNACDDALKRFLSRPELFNQIYTHTDVRLALGWLSVFVAGATGLYGWKVEFEKSKPVVWAGVILYVVLTTIQTLYAYFIERDTVYVGKRKTFDKRIVTERITIASSTAPPPSLSSSPSPAPTSTISSPSTTYPPPPTNCPQYTLTISFLRSTSGGKSLLGKGKAKVQAGYNAFFDEKGAMDVQRFERWVGECVGSVMDGKAE